MSTQTAEADMSHDVLDVTDESCADNTVGVIVQPDKAAPADSDEVAAPLASPYPLVMRRVHAIISAVHAIAEHGLDSKAAGQAAARAVKRLHALTNDLPDTLDLAGVLDDLDDVGIGEVLVAAHEALAVVAAAAEDGHDHGPADGQHVPAELVQALAQGNVVVRAAGPQPDEQQDDDGRAPEGLGGYL